MAINEIMGSGAIPVESIRRATNSSDEKKEEVKKTDRVEVSSEARGLYEAGQTKQDDEIRKKIESGFYNSSNVIEKIADEVLKDLRSSNG